MNPDEQIVILRYYWHDTVAITIFEHGTAIVSTTLHDAISIMQAYAVPHGGEGTPFGDMQPLEMDDGNVLVVFPGPADILPSSGLPGGQAVRSYSPHKEDETLLSTKSSPTEVLIGSMNKMLDKLPLCLHARDQRNLDARSLKIVATWQPTPSSPV